MYVYENHVKSTVFSILALLFKARTSYSGEILTKLVLRFGSTNSLEKLSRNMLKINPLLEKYYQVET